MKVIVNLLLVILGATVLIGCEADEKKGGGDGRSESAEAKKIIDDLKGFVQANERETVTMTREDVEKILKVLRPESIPDPAGKQAPLATDASSMTVAETRASPRPEPVAVAVAKAKEKIASAASPSDSRASASKEKAGDKTAAPIGVEDKKAVHKDVFAVVPDSGTKRPDDFPEVVIDPTTGFEFTWNAKKGIWGSSAFGEFLKGSTKQNDSFCWLLTQNSSGVEKGAIPSDWVHLPLNDRKSIMIVEKTRVEKVSAALGTMNAPALAETAPESKAETSPGESGTVEQEMKTTSASEGAGKGQSQAMKPGEPGEEKVLPDKTRAPAHKTMVTENAAEKPGAPTVKVEPPQKKPAEPVVVAAPPVAAPAVPARVEEPARRRPVSQVLPAGAVLPDGRRLVAPPQYQTFQYQNNVQPSVRPAVRAIPARKVDAKTAGDVTNGNKEQGSESEAPQNPVPSAKSKPVVRPKITIKSRRVGNLWRNKQEPPAQSTPPAPPAQPAQPVKPKQ